MASRQAIRERIFVFGRHDEETLRQIEDVARHAVRAALMADGHVGYVMPIGGVAAFEHAVSVAGVGFDIACGNAAILTDLYLDDLKDHLEEIADEIQATISFGLGRTNRAPDAPVDHPLFESEAWDAIPAPRSEREELREKARMQLGTVGGGNHYVDVFADEEDRIWVGVHFGSRGLGYTIARGFLALAAGKKWGDSVPEHLALLDLGSELGQRYWALMTLAGEYAYVGREWVARKVVSILGGQELDLVHNHHNFAWREVHDGRELIVVRKGATPAWPGQRSFVGGSMGDLSVILRGTESENPEVVELQRSALYSTVHGAGRIMSRTEAKGKIRKGKVVQPGRVRREEMLEALKSRGVILRGGDVDEAPQVYRPLEEVLAAQGPTIEILHRLRPLVVVMAGPEDFDPYKD
ncbi:RtcB family protein [Brockia lithotrophica]|uniref:3'-phosphate/5'-hydroxy nucleic acid ligase n=1 Tax=Brockia lithotrophica TaxID=933949 RepID=A0A660L5E8_9BACL|nr:RtcB family protein [Brockia lithotrophica]RKQ88555.1 tRNA-splicing ligase RtcB [Brockia lithotrophica]